MDFVDRTVVALADPNTRAGLFDDGGLASLIGAGYRIDGLTGPYSPVFDEVRLGVPALASANADGMWAQVGETKPTEVHLSLSGLGDGTAPRVEALWRGGVVARFVPAGDPIIEAFTAWPDLALLDQMIIDAQGNLPGGPVGLEKARRAQLRALARTGMAGNDPLSVADVDAWLARAGVTSVADLLARPATAPTGMVRITFDQPKPVVAQPRLVPLTVALLVRDVGFSIADLLEQGRTIRERLERGGTAPSAKPELPIRFSVVVGWVVPAVVFDDADWPGAAQNMNAAQRRAARLAAARTWLADEGVGLVAVTT